MTPLTLKLHAIFHVFQQTDGYTLLSWASALLLLGGMENDIQLPRVLTLAETAELMGVSKRTLTRIIKCKQFPAFRVGNQWRVVESELAKWIRCLDKL